MLFHIKGRDGIWLLFVKETRRFPVGFPAIKVPFCITICMLGNFACIFVVCGFFFIFLNNFFKNIYREYYQSVKQFGSGSGPTFCRAWSGSKRFAEVISRRQKLPLVGKELKGSYSKRKEFACLRSKFCSSRVRLRWPHWFDWAVKP